MYFRQTNDQHNRSHGHRSPNLSQSLPQCLRRLAVLNRFNARTMAGRKYHYTHCLSSRAGSCLLPDVRSRVHRPRQWSTYLPEMYSVFNDHGNSAARQNRPESLLFTYIFFGGVLRGIFRVFSENFFEKKSAVSDAFLSEITLEYLKKAAPTTIVSAAPLFISQF